MFNILLHAILFAFLLYYFSIQIDNGLILSDVGSDWGKLPVIICKCSTCTQSRQRERRLDSIEARGVTWEGTIVSPFPSESYIATGYESGKCSHAEINRFSKG